MPRLLRLTLTPDGAPPSEGWGFRIDRTGKSGWFVGSLPQAARSALSPARASRRAGVVLTLPGTGRGGLSSRQFVVMDPLDTHRLLNVDDERLRARYDAQRRRLNRVARWRAPTSGVAILCTLAKHWNKYPRPNNGQKQ